MAVHRSTLTVADDATVSEGIKIAPYLRGSIGPLPTGFVTTGITLQCANVLDDPVSGDWFTCQDSAGADIAAVASQAAGAALAINSAAFNYRWLRLSFADAQSGGPLEIPIVLIDDK